MHFGLDQSQGITMKITFNTENNRYIYFLYLNFYLHDKKCKYLMKILE